MKATGYFAELQREVRKKIRERDTEVRGKAGGRERENGLEHLCSGNRNKEEWVGPGEDKEWGKGHHCVHFYHKGIPSLDPSALSSQMNHPDTMLLLSHCQKFSKASCGPKSLALCLTSPLSGSSRPSQTHLLFLPYLQLLSKRSSYFLDIRGFAPTE